MGPNESPKPVEELARLRLLREVVKASESGMSQTEIAAALQLTSSRT